MKFTLIEEAEDLYSQIWKFILKNYPTTNKASECKGSTWLLPDGSYLNLPGKSHLSVDEKVAEEFSDFDPLNFRYGVLLDEFNCVRMNNGLDDSKGMFAKYDRYITLPKRLTTNQLYAIADWLECYPHPEIEIRLGFGNEEGFTYNTENINYIINRLRGYKNSGELKESLDEKILFEIFKL